MPVLGRAYCPARAPRSRHFSSPAPQPLDRSYYHWLPQIGTVTMQAQQARGKRRKARVGDYVWSGDKASRPHVMSPRAPPCLPVWCPSTLRGATCTATPPGVMGRQPDPCARLGRPASRRDSPLPNQRRCPRCAQRCNSLRDSSSARMHSESAALQYFVWR